MLEQIDKHVFMKFEETRQKRLPVKDVNLPQVTMK